MAHQYCSDKSYETFKYYWSWVGSVHIMCVQVHSVAQSCLTLWDPTECSPPGSSVQGIFPARILEWVAISSSRGSSQLRDLNPGLLWLLHLQVESLPLCHLGSPWPSQHHLLKSGRSQLGNGWNVPQSREGLLTQLEEGAGW